MDGPMKHETSARCRASRSVKQSMVPNALPSNQNFHDSSRSKFTLTYRKLVLFTYYRVFIPHVSVQTRCYIRYIACFRPNFMEPFYQHGLTGISTGISNYIYGFSLLWRHNERDGVSNHQRLDGLLNRLFKPRSKKTPKLLATGLC